VLRGFASWPARTDLVTCSHPRSAAKPTGVASPQGAAREMAHSDKLRSVRRGRASRRDAPPWGARQPSRKDAAPPTPRTQPTTCRTEPGVLAPRARPARANGTEICCEAGRDQSPTSSRSLYAQLRQQHFALGPPVLDLSKETAVSPSYSKRTSITLEACAGPSACAVGASATTAWPRVAYEKASAEESTGRGDSCEEPSALEAGSVRRRRTRDGDPGRRSGWL
jgi:hypothetical protein